MTGFRFSGKTKSGKVAVVLATVAVSRTSEKSNFGLEHIVGVRLRSATPTLHLRSAGPGAGVPQCRTLNIGILGRGMHEQVQNSASKDSSMRRPNFIEPGEEHVPNPWATSPSGLNMNPWLYGIPELLARLKDQGRIPDPMGMKRINIFFLDRHGYYDDENLRVGNIYNWGTGSVPDDVESDEAKWKRIASQAESIYHDRFHTREGQEPPAPYPWTLQDLHAPPGINRDVLQQILLPGINRDSMKKLVIQPGQPAASIPQLTLFDIEVDLNAVEVPAYVPWKLKMLTNMILEAQEQEQGTAQRCSCLGDLASAHGQFDVVLNDWSTLFSRVALSVNSTHEF